MAAFAVMAIGRNRALGKSIATAYPKTSMALSRDSWLIVDAGVGAKAIGEKLNLKSLSGEAIIVEFDLQKCHGIASAPVWDRLARMARPQCASSIYG